MRERYQGGSLAGFIIIGVLLMLVLAGGLYGLNRYNAERASDEVAQNDQQDQTSREEDKTNEESDTQTETASDGQAQTRTDTTDESTDQATSESSDTSDADELPATGPSDSLFTMLAIAALTYGGVYYLRSRA